MERRALRAVFERDILGKGLDPQSPPGKEVRYMFMMEHAEKWDADRICSLLGALDRAEGCRRMMEYQCAAGHNIGRCKTRRLIREDGLVSKRTRKARAVTTTDSNHDHLIAENILRR